MALLNANVQKQVRQLLAGIENPVKILVFTQGGEGTIECTMCSETRQLVEEVGALSEKIKVEVYDFVQDSSQVEKFKIDKIPSIVILPDDAESKDYGIRLFGIPSGYEFGSLMEDILMVGRRKTDLNVKTLQELGKLTRPVHIQVYVTPT